ncbi:MAG: hypothetical protein AUJ31_00940 [Parcubacteria group bacterium CG1_02_39_15]|uniref:Uncharacterized protein n=3 Tax=Candidatus Nealsoniibacteriota TaxID=1817911 RepID=A0A2G9YSF6_9BACT|nr:MAG: hypothetical protein AUJ31_00940 [Parcubacteria group bacterium CG1_02_39_15]PIP22180.1 MAG: hypothetical protein COX38_02055 [Candidatus Nealsonbacteria bacterium CG23_combo_of_CG06-09_8_20_14_all_39_25]PIW90309.1 MAG: hypothetical protein COZ92_01070 [Candidatus Nealsonbacteria bacterium CG_4_8_14_3_um_filter_40_11]PIZ87910.1 MAG: hypothetical protein COX91_03065 [Candidatus Nealsonbacteria bacterium CG_4_10_14_0_2_um_filter_39_15]
MINELITLLVLIVSALGMLAVIFRKIPALVKLPDVGQSVALKPLVESWYKNSIDGIKNMPGLRSFSTETFLRKTLSKIRILSLKTDNKTSTWLQKLKEKSQKDKMKESDNYWEELKKSTKHNK